MGAKDLREALNGPKGAMDGYLELADEAEIKADIRELINAAQSTQNQRREHFAAMAMQGLCANSIAGSQHIPANLAAEALEYADALIEALDRAKERK